MSKVQVVLMLFQKACVDITKGIACLYCSNTTCKSLLTSMISAAVISTSIISTMTIIPTSVRCVHSTSHVAYSIAYSVSVTKALPTIHQIHVDEKAGFCTSGPKQVCLAIHVSTNLSHQFQVLGYDKHWFNLT